MLLSKSDHTVLRGGKNQWFFKIEIWFFGFFGFFGFLWFFGFLFIKFFDIWVKIESRKITKEHDIHFYSKAVSFSELPYKPDQNTKTKYILNTK